MSDPATNDTNNGQREYRVDPGELLLTPEQIADDPDRDLVVEALAVRLYENDPESYFNDGDDVQWRDNYADRDQYRHLARTALVFFGSPS